MATPEKSEKTRKRFTPPPDAKKPEPEDRDEGSGGDKEEPAAGEPPAGARELSFDEWMESDEW